METDFQRRGVALDKLGGRRLPGFWIVDPVVPRAAAPWLPPTCLGRQCSLLLPFGSPAVMELGFDPSILGLQIAGDLGPLTLYRTKKGKVVAYPRAKPKCPPSPSQMLQRWRFARCMATWKDLTPGMRADYESTTRKLSLCLTGANLWIHLCLSHDLAFWNTLRRQGGFDLVSFPFL